ncbi:MAG: hypothetical protein IPP88_04350 [Betaproteobacteria bacterium]|nr:hypothetical protein [Betaproteobacteria bacterium]
MDKTHLHGTRDAAVERAFGWGEYTPEMPDEDIFRQLLKLVRARVAK